MSDDLVPRIPLMSAAKARDLGRAHKGWADYLAEQGLVAEARRAEQDSQWWLAYAESIKGKCGD